MLRPFEWKSDHLLLLDQRHLPGQEVWLQLETVEQVAEAIVDMAVRGAPAIGMAAAYGLVLAAQRGHDRAAADALLRASRPTAVNLFWALDRMARVSWDAPALLQEAVAIEEEDRAMNQAMGRWGLDCLPESANVMTICNTGGIATSGWGTALGVIRTAYEIGRIRHVYACETRPRMQGLRLTAWELMQEGIPFQMIADSAATSILARGEIDAIFVGADRIAANGDTANKIGTFMLAVAAERFGVPFYVVAPSSTIDPQTLHGRDIPIEERAAEEITEIEGVRIAPEGCPVFNPAFDVTPHEFITGIITERGLHRPPYVFTAADLA